MAKEELEEAEEALEDAEEEFEEEDEEAEEDGEGKPVIDDGTKPKSKLIAIVAALFGGTFGIDMFYLGQTVPGVIILIMGAFAIARLGSRISIYILIALILAQLGRTIFYTVLKQETWEANFRTKKPIQYDEFGPIED